MWISWLLGNVQSVRRTAPAFSVTLTFFSPILVLTYYNTDPMNKSQGILKMPAQKALPCIHRHVNPCSCTRDFLPLTPFFPSYPLQIYMTENKGPRKSQLMKERRKKWKKEVRYFSLLEVSTFPICKRFICLQIMKLEWDNFATQSTWFSWTGQIDTRLADTPLPLTAAPSQGLFFLSSCFLFCNFYLFFGQ